MTNRSPPARTLHLQVDATFDAVRSACGQCREFLIGAGLSSREGGEWELVLAEALNNAVLHGSQGVPAPFIELDLVVNERLVEVRVTDRGPGFKLPAEIELPPAEAERGRGLFLIRAHTDSMDYLCGTGENCLVMRRLRREPRPIPNEAEETELALRDMTEELSSAYESLSGLFRFTGSLQQCLSAGGRSFHGLDDLLLTAHADWYVLRLVDADGSRLEAVSCSDGSWEGPPLAFVDAEPSCELAAVTRREDLWFDQEHPLGPLDSLGALAGGGCGIVHPLVVQDVVIGTLAVGSRSATPLRAGQVALVRTIGDFLAIHIRNEQFLAAQRRAELLQREYELAGRIQQSLLPREHPSLGFWRTLGHCESAERVGGDFYDILRVANHGLLLAVADVMGKGLPAALMAAVFRTLLHTRPDLACRPGAFMEWLNRNLVEPLGRLDMFITAQLAYVDGGTRELRVSGAGHPPLLRADPLGTVLGVPSSGPPLGVVAEAEYDETTLGLPAGALVFLHTDGLNETRNPSGKLLGLSPLRRWLGDMARRGESALACSENLRRYLRQFEGSETHTDDRTFLLLAEELSRPDRLAAQVRQVPSLVHSNPSLECISNPLTVIHSA